jgi:hypothetical protein
VPFANDLSLKYVARGVFLSDRPLEYVGETEVITIPAGTRTDLASVPRIFWWLLAPFGAHEAAAVLHDWNCDELNRHHRQMIAWKAGRLPDPPLPPQINSRDADGLFRRVCRECGVPAPLRWELWWGVRIGALFNPARRPGSLRTAPAVLALTAVNLAAAYGAWAFAAWTYGLLPWT